MAVKLPSSTDLAGYQNTRDALLGFLYAVVGTTDWLTWLQGTLQLIAKCGIGNLLVVPDDANATTIHILTGRCSASGTVVTYAGGTLDLAAANNATSYIWGTNSSGTLVIGHGLSGGGWPGGAHIKLAEVTLAAGVITAIVDRRLDPIFKIA